MNLENTKTAGLSVLGLASIGGTRAQAEKNDAAFMNVSLHCLTFDFSV